MKQDHTLYAVTISQFQKFFHIKYSTFEIILSDVTVCRYFFSSFNYSTTSSEFFTNRLQLFRIHQATLRLNI